jgi:hypothetical protein
MAQFRGALQGNRGAVSRLGSKQTGLRASVRGWTAGVSVYAYHDEQTGEDVFKVREDGGSHALRAGQALVTIRHRGDASSEPKIISHLPAAEQHPKGEGSA